MKCIYSLLFLSTFVSCSLLEKEEIDNSICPDGDCWVKLYTDFEEDSNGYHHVTKTEDINNFIDYLNEKLYLSGDEIYDLMSHVWGDEGNESLMNHFSEEVTNKILQDSGKYLDTKN